MMDERPTSPATQERSMNTTLHLSNGSPVRRSSSCRPNSVASPDGNISTSPYYFYHYNTLTVIKENSGYGMKVSGDNPVYVQSVKEGGAAEKAGLHSGDKIIKVNGTDVTHFTHVEVVELIKSCLEVELTVEQRVVRNTRQPPPMPTNSSTSKRCSSPMPKATSPIAVAPTNANSNVNTLRPLHPNHIVPARDRITAPQPVDLEKRRQLEFQREQTFRLMLEREQCYIEGLRSELAKCTDSSNEQELSGHLMCAERRIQTLQEKLHDITSNSNNFNTSSSISSSSLLDVQLPSTPPPPPPLSTLPTRLAVHPSSSDTSFSHIPSSPDIAPPLPSRNRNLTSPVLVVSPLCSPPPPLPPRQYLHSPINNIDGNQDQFVNTTVSTDLSFPSSPLPIHHEKTKSNPDKINNMNMSLLAEDNNSGSLSDLSSVKRSKGGLAWNVDSPFTSTPPGTPPPPYHGATQHHKENSVPSPPVPPPPDETDESNKDETCHETLNSTDLSSPSSTLGATIISMEDDDMSDPDMSQLGDLGPFKSLSKIWEHNIHLAVFLNFILTHHDPSSILFYLVTDLYKEGNGKEMRKWAYEIHSSFLGPGAPLRLNNVDENIAREIDDVLLNESDKEEILRKVFWKARQKAKEELNDRLADFQQKKATGLGLIYGPSDTVLDECIHDKSKELKMIESYLMPHMNPLMEDIDKEVVDDRKFTTAAALGTVLSKVFGLRGQHFNTLMDRCPTFVSKEKSFKARLIIGKSRKVTVRGHHFVAHQYFTVTYCNHCQLIIRGIGPQGYQCTNCLLNIHRSCVKVLEENCFGPLLKKEKTNDRISKLMDKIRPERGETRRKPSSLNISQIEKIRRQAEDREEGSLTDNDSGEKLSGNVKGKGNSNTNTSNVIDSFKEGDEKQMNKVFLDSESNLIHVSPLPSRNLSQRCKPSGTSINRSESYKERIHQKRPIRDRRKTSDPNLSKTNTDVEIDTNAQYPYPTTNSGSSSNSNLSSRSLDSPSNSLEVVGCNNKGSCENTTVSVPSNFSTSGNPTCPANKSSTWNSDSEEDADPPDVTESVPPEALRSLSPLERKRQEVINELFHTERSHVGALKVLNKLFYKPMKEQQILPEEFLQLLFPNLEQILTIHLQFNNLMEVKKKENPVIGNVGDILLKTFDGSEGEAFKTAAATFCCRQKVALEMFKEKRSKKDSPLYNFLKEAECDPKCRRLQLQDIMPTEMQRLTKYPLLFENLAKYSKNNIEEEKSVRRALECSKEIVNRIDEAVKEAADQDQLNEIQKKLDKSAFDKSDHQVAAEVRNLDLTKRKVIYQGSLSWRIANKTKLVELHVLLLEDLIILLQKVHEKYLLQFFNTNSATSERNHVVFSPVIKMSTVLVRPNAVDKRALYLVDTSPNGGQIYDLVAPSFNEKKEWFRRISDAAEAHKLKEGKSRNSRSSDVSTNSTQDFDSSANGPDSSTKTKETESGSTVNENANNRHNQDEAPSSGLGAESTVKKSGNSGSGGTNLGLQSKRNCSVEGPHLITEAPLIEPSQVLISQRAVLTAEPVLTPLERLRRKDETIREALLEKQKLVADILHVPKEEFDTIADLAAEPAYDKEASELVLAAMNQADQLTSLLNECLRVTEEDAIAAGCEVNLNSAGATGTTAKQSSGHSGGSGSGSGVGSSVRTFPGVPVLKLRPISQMLSSHLTLLLTLMTKRDEERERLRQELQRSREKLHAMHEMQQRVQRTNDLTPTQSETAQNTGNEKVAEGGNEICP